MFSNAATAGMDNTNMIHRLTDQIVKGCRLSEVEHAAKSELLRFLVSGVVAGIPLDRFWVLEVLALCVK